MKAAASVRFSVEADGVGWMLIDDAGATANLLTRAMQEALAAALDEFAAAQANGKVRAVVVTSGKERIFVAGADLAELAALPDAAAAEAFARRGQELLQRIADAPVPFVAAIHGACAGGGFELALACHWRIATDATVTRLGLPETSLGTIPGWGGCVRLPRLIGVKPALDHILAAKLVTAAAALEAGLVHEVVPAGELKARARSAALKLAAEGHPVRPTPAAAVPGALRELREKVRVRTRGHLPAPLAAIDAVEQTETLSIAKGLEVEATIFGHVTAGETCKNLIRVFGLKEAAKKRTLDGWFERRAGLRPALAVEGSEPSIQARADQRPALRPIRRIGIVGAGVMGAGIAQLAAMRGLEVVLRDVTPEIVARGAAVARGVFDDAVRRGQLTAGEANAAVHRIETTTTWAGFETCELVIEAIVENAAAKRALFAELAGVARADALLVSNTSALPIEEIAGHVPAPERTLGIHFFNPVGRMPLVELIVAASTSRDSADRALAFVKSLGKSPVICRSSPGFLVTRGLFFYLNAAVRRWERGEAADAIDRAMVEFGWPMGPLRLIDEVGLDVSDAIFAEMARYFPERFERTTACARLVAAGLRGRKNGTGRGFYRYEERAERMNETETRALAVGAGAGASDREADADAMKAGSVDDVVGGLMPVLVEEARRCLVEGVVASADDVDFAFISGTGFPAFRGGLLRWADGVV